MVLGDSLSEGRGPGDDSILVAPVTDVFSILGHFFNLRLAFLPLLAMSSGWAACLGIAKGTHWRLRTSGPAVARARRRQGVMLRRASTPLAAYPSRGS